MQTNFEHIPNELKQHPNWVAFRLLTDKETGKTKKLPVDVHTGKGASCSEAATWADFDTARAYTRENSCDGLGFEFSRSAGLVGIDIDHCYDPETKSFNDIAKDLMKKGGGYMEFSPSGTGIHLWYRGSKPEGPVKNTANGLEMYDSSRYFTVTGHPLPWSDPDIGRAPEGFLQWVMDTYLAVPGQKRAAEPEGQAPSGEPEDRETLSDQELLALAGKGKKGEFFKKLFQGNWQEFYPSQSEADTALCFQLAFWSGRNREQIDRLYRRSGLMRDKWDARHYADGATYGSRCLDYVIDRTEKVYQAAQKKKKAMEKQAVIEEKEGCLYLKSGTATKLLADFVLRPVELLRSDKRTLLTVDCLPADSGKVVRLDMETTDFSALRKFKDRLNHTSFELSYFGRESSLELLKKHLRLLDWKNKTGVEALGIYSHGGRKVFVSDKTAFAAGGEPVDSLAQMPDSVCLTTELPERDCISREDLTRLGPALLAYNEPAKTASVLAWIACCFLKSTLREHKIKMPVLFCIGEAGSGKSTTLESILMPVFGAGRVSAATQMTPFTLLKDAASSNLVPMVLDEFKPGRMSRKKLVDLSNHFRDSYDGHAGLRGRSDLSITSYELYAPLAVAGEEALEETAVRERSVELLFSKRDLQSPERRTAFRTIRQSRQQLGEFGRLLLESALSVEDDTILAWYQEGRDQFAGKYPERIVNNLACLCAGLQLAEAAAASLGLTWEEAFQTPMWVCRLQLEEAVRNYLLDGRRHPLTVVEQSLAIMARMPLDRKSVLQISDDRKILYLRLNSIYDNYTKYRRDHAVVGEVLSFGQFKKQLMYTDYYIDNSVQKWFCGVHARCWALNYELLRETIDCSGFESDPAGQINTSLCTNNY